MATHSSVLAWRIPWMEGPGGLGLWGCKESDMTERLNWTELNQISRTFLLGDKDALIP